MNEERFPHTRKPFAGGGCGWRMGSFGATEESAATGVQEGKVERFPHRGRVLTSTHQPERLVCSPAGAGGAGS